jgi:hypothetical protein
MRLGSIIRNLAALLAILLICAGCGGIAATQTISPLMFLIPGLGVNKRPPVPAAAPSQSEPVVVLARAN